MSDLIRFLAFIGLGFAVMQILLHFSLREFWKEHGRSKE